MITISAKKHYETDLWLATQAGECVHEWDCIRDPEVYEQEWKCNKCTEIEVRHNSDGPPLDVTPRSKDLGAMANVVRALNLEVDLTLFSEHVQIYLNKPIGDYKKYMVADTGAKYADHPSPQHAAAWALVLALREVKS